MTSVHRRGVWRLAGAGAAVWILMSAAPVLAQFEREQIFGVVADATGGVIPGATVTVTSLQTRAVQSTVTDASGYYNFPSLPPWLYDVSVELG